MIHLVAVLSAASTTTTTLAKHTTSFEQSILTPIAKPLAWVLAGIYSVVPDYGVAIMCLAVLWMIIISPLTLKSTRSMLAMQKLQPELKKLQAQHKNDKQAFAQAQMDLFREHNVSPFGSCLPMLLPLPVFFALFEVIDGLSHTTKVNGLVTYTPQYLDHHTAMYQAIASSHGKLEAFGMNLAQGALTHHSGIAAAAPYWIALLVMAGTSYVQSAMMMSRNKKTQPANPQMQMMKYLSPLFSLVCIRFPAGVIVYYATSNLCRILQQDAMYRFDPKVKALVNREVEEVEEMAQEIDERELNRPGYTPPRRERERMAEAAKSSGGQGGRSRFRDLLAAAAEQQRSQQEAKPKAKGGGDGRGQPGPARSGSTRSRANSGNRAGGDGKSSTGNGNRGAKSSAGGNRNRPSGSRTNRKRRGR